FNDADIVYVTPVYPAGEEPIAGISSGALVEGLRQRGHHAAHTIADETALAAELGEMLEAGDIVVCLGAGDITRWAAGLAGAIDGVREAA
ncbi:MAG: UDP-N-acetylmuramate--L-alanine ligase, partial [Sphingomonadaceae bacterium]|nr:UDP-N-acetylmuramate--L-alanine ligase [Sphingomonadaceae bacterium]